MQLTTSELRLIFEKLISHLEDVGSDPIEIPHDYYWYIPKEVVYDPYQQPQTMTLGQLSDDWSELQKIIKGDNEPLAYDFVWLASILRSVGDELYI